KNLVRSLAIIVTRPAACPDDRIVSIKSYALADDALQVSACRLEVGQPTLRMRLSQQDKPSEHQRTHAQPGAPLVTAESQLRQMLVARYRVRRRALVCNRKREDAAFRGRMTGRLSRPVLGLAESKLNEQT